MTCHCWHSHPGQARWRLRKAIRTVHLIIPSLCPPFATNDGSSSSDALRSRLSTRRASRRLIRNTVRRPRTTSHNITISTTTALRILIGSAFHFKFVQKHFLIVLGGRDILKLAEVGLLRSSLVVEGNGSGRVGRTGSEESIVFPNLAQAASVVLSSITAPRLSSKHEQSISGKVRLPSSART